jgi:hypothetical protein
MTPLACEIADLRQTEMLLSRLYIQGGDGEWIVRIWWHVNLRRQELEAM